MNKIKLIAIIGLVFAAFLTQEVSAASETLDAVKSRGKLKCGVSQGLPGFSSPDDKNEWTGLDVDYCRAVAAAIFGDPKKVEFVGLSAKARFSALTSGEIDVLSRNTTWTLDRDAGLGLNFIGVMYYDGQGFLVHSKLGVKSAKELSGAVICTQTGTTTELNVSDYFRTNNIPFKLLGFENNDEVVKAYETGRCDVLTTDRSGLAAEVLKMSNQRDHVLLPEVISKEPLGPAVRQGDAAWEDIARWVYFTLVAAEEFGLTSKNVDSMGRSTKNPEIKRMLSLEGSLAAKLSLGKNWARDVIKLVGNYGEIYERNVGENTPLKLSRGINALYTEGGLLYAPPFR